MKSMHIEIVGNGPPLVMLHGWGMSSGVWQPIMKRLAKNFTLHLVDLPGMGASRSIEPYHLYALADVVAEHIPGQADVLGWSLGAQVLMRIAINQPDLIRRVVMVGATPCFVEANNWPQGVPMSTFHDFSQRMMQDYQNTMIQFLTLQCMGASDARVTVKQLRASFSEKPMPLQSALQQALLILLETDLREDVALITKPTLLIHGDRDTLAPVQAAHWMSQRLSNNQLRVISGASHAPFLSHQQLFVDAVTQFLQA